MTTKIYKQRLPRKDAKQTNDFHPNLTGPIYLIGFLWWHFFFVVDFIDFISPQRAGQVVFSKSEEEYKKIDKINRKEKNEQLEVNENRCLVL